MQPPQNLSNRDTECESYLDRLLCVSEEIAAQHELRRKEELALKKLQVEAEKARLEPLEDQIRRWWANVAEVDRNRRFHIAEIAAHCRGKYQTRPALRDVAAALRCLGWTQTRDWRKAGRNKRGWRQTSSSRSYTFSIKNSEESCQLSKCQKPQLEP
jgi:hypothetical protein